MAMELRSRPWHVRGAAAWRTRRVQRAAHGSSADGAQSLLVKVCEKFLFGTFCRRGPSLVLPMLDRAPEAPVTHVRTSVHRP